MESSCPFGVSKLVTCWAFILVRAIRLLVGEQCAFSLVKKKKGDCGGEGDSRTKTVITHPKGPKQISFGKDS